MKERIRTIEIPIQIAPLQLFMHSIKMADEQRLNDTAKKDNERYENDSWNLNPNKLYITSRIMESAVKVKVIGIGKGKETIIHFKNGVQVNESCCNNSFVTKADILELQKHK